MEIKQLNEYKIEFYSEEEYNEYMFYNQKKINRIYNGKISDISEELAKKIVEYSENTPFSRMNGGLYLSYAKCDLSKRYFICITAKESFETLSDLPYCVITKI